MDTAQRIREYLFGTLIPTPAGAWPDNETDLFERGLDSLRLMQLLVFIEQQLGVKIPDEEITAERISTVARLTELVDMHRAASPSAT